MKTKLCILLAVVSFASFGFGQGTFIYDQESATESTGGGGIDTIQSNQPIGQSFTPTFSEVGFIRLFVEGNASTSIFLNLRTNSITGPVLGFTGSISFPGLFTGYTNFFFSTPVAVTPGVTYYFDIALQSGGGAVKVYNAYNYPGGVEFFQGAPSPSFDLWFREGIVPEPSSAVLFLIGIGTFACVRRFRKKNRVHENKTET